MIEDAWVEAEWVAQAVSELPWLAALHEERVTITDHQLLLLIAPCARCGHDWAAHHEDGMGEAGTDCAMVTNGSWSCSCPCYVDPKALEP